MPNYIMQKTLGGSMEFSGVALHTGKETSVRVLPGAPDTGYRFRMLGIEGAPEVEASVHNINDTLLATSLGVNGASVKTVEHLLSALAGSGIDNAVIETMGDEIPIMDGSAAPFVRGIEMVGTVEQDVPKKMLRILDRIETSENGSTASFDPADAFQVKFVIDFEHPVIGKQEMTFEYSPESFRREIAYARTFGFLKDVHIGDDKVVNPGGLRAPDEFVRHKILDTLGDLSLLGIPIIGAYEGYKAGHRINRLLMQAVLANPDSWELVMVEEDAEGRDRYLEIEPADVQPIAYAL
jgi:UDP-3-O-[3-hydroxymyristoyl] N-acetylglucosamine deacetylase